MSNNKQQFKSWDQYAAEAKQAPFELPVSEDETIVIEAPTGVSLIQWASAYRAGDMEAMLITLCREQWKRVEELLGQGGYKAMRELITDMMMFFDLAEDVVLVGQGGGKVTERDPRKIEVLLKQGYKPVGEATSRI